MKRNLIYTVICVGLILLMGYACSRTVRPAIIANDTSAYYNHYNRIAKVLRVNDTLSLDQCLTVDVEFKASKDTVIFYNGGIVTGYKPVFYREIKGIMYMYCEGVTGKIVLSKVYQDSLHQDVSHEYLILSTQTGSFILSPTGECPNIKKKKQ